MTEDTRDYIRVGQWMRENRKNSNYRTTVQAMCELIDNSIEENAENIVLGIFIDNMRMGKISKIIVADDGDGMSQEIQWDAVCENAGSRMDRRTQSIRGRKKLGKYGVGLPKASDSQCDTWHVYSWQKKPKSAHHSVIDWSTGDFNNKIPKPEAVPAPPDYVSLFGLEDSISGTMVIWDNLGGPSFTWQTYNGLARNLQIELGRIYRKYLQHEDSLNIIIQPIPSTGQTPEQVYINIRDPLFLTADTGIPEPDFPDWVEGESLFQLETSQSENIPVTITTLDGDGNRSTATVEIIVTASIAKNSARTVINGAPPGMFEWGKEVNKNKGVSFCREGREIRLDGRWCLNEPQERWWALEYDFPEELDKLLAISTDKQDYTALTQGMSFEFEDIKMEGESDADALDRVKNDDPGSAFIYELINELKQKIVRLRSLISLQRPPRIRTRACRTCGNVDCTCDEPDPCTDCGVHPCQCIEEVPDPEPEEEAEEIADEQTDDNEVTETDMPEIEEYLRSFSVPDNEIERISKNLVVRNKHWVITTGRGFGRSLLFAVEKIGGANLVVLNHDHPAYAHIFAGLKIDEGMPEGVPDEFKNRMHNASTALFLMISAWAELERISGEDEKDMLEQTREDWGRKMREFVREMNRRREG